MIQNDINLLVQETIDRIFRQSIIDNLNMFKKTVENMSKEEKVSRTSIINRTLLNEGFIRNSGHWSHKDDTKTLLSTESALFIVITNALVKEGYFLLKEDGTVCLPIGKASAPIEDVFTLKCLQHLMDMDPNYVGLEVATQDTLDSLIEFVKGNGFDSIIVNMFKDRDIEKDPIKLTDLGVVINH